MPLPSANKAAPLALKPRGDVTRMPKQGYQWPPQKRLMSSKIKKNNFIDRHPTCYYLHLNFSALQWKQTMFETIIARKL